MDGRSPYAFAERSSEVGVRGELAVVRVMAQHHVATLARCPNDRVSNVDGVMGIREEGLIDGVEFGGAASYLGDAAPRPFKPLHKKN